MLLLALDASGSACSVALRRDDAIVASARREMARGHGAALVPMIGQVLEGVPPERLDALAVVTGPGSFTGIRIAVAAARGLALALEKPLVGVSGFDAVAWRAGRYPAGAGDVRVIAIESRRSQPFVEVRDRDGTVTDHGKPVDPRRFWLTGRPGPDMQGGVLLFGDAAERLAAAAPPGPARFRIADTLGPSADDVSAIAAARLRAGRALPGRKEVGPLYLRAPL